MFNVFSKLFGKKEKKDSKNDKKCLLEARLKGRQPIAVSDTGDTYDYALGGAVDKLKSMLSTIAGRMAEN